MESRAAQMVCQFYHVACETIERKLLHARHFRLTVAARVGAHHAKMPRQVRDPCVHALGAAFSRVQQKQRLLGLPPIAEVVHHVAQLDAVAGAERLHFSGTAHRAFSYRSKLQDANEPVMLPGSDWPRRAGGTGTELQGCLGYNPA